jgi:hypothetical protein
MRRGVPMVLGLEWSHYIKQRAGRSQTAHVLQTLSPPSLHRCSIEQQFQERNIQKVICDESAEKPTIKHATRDSDTCFTKTSGQAMYRLVPSDLAACTNHRVKEMKGAQIVFADDAPALPR